MNKKHVILIIYTLFFILFSAAASVSAELVPAGQDTAVGLGKFDHTGILIFGDYKDCGIELFFYLLTVNETDQETLVTLPRTIFVEPKNYYVSNRDYTFKNLGSAWRPEQFADAKSGQPLAVDETYKFVLPPHTAYSVMGKVDKIDPQDFHRIKHTENEYREVYAKAELSFGDKTMSAEGYIQREGSICDAVTVRPLNGSNYFVGSYGISVAESPTCSFSYYYEITNTDSRYATVVELPQWINLNQNRWDIGCKILDETCDISGFRHYAYAELPSVDAIIPDSEYTFCDKDLSIGDFCYMDGGQWWLTIPAGKTVVIRSMVNDLCSSPRGLRNPLEGEKVEMEILVTDAGSNQFHVVGEIKGREKMQPPAGTILHEAEKEGAMWISPDGKTDPNRTHMIRWNDQVIEVNNSVISGGLTFSTDVPLVAKAVVPGKNVPSSIPTFVRFNGAESSPDCAALCEMKLPATGFSGMFRSKESVSLQKLSGMALQIPKLNILTDVVSVPQDERNGSWAVEWLDVDAGLLEGTALPGEGVSVIAAHNHLNQMEIGPFVNLFKLEKDDRVFVNRSDGSMTAYQVYKNVVLSADQSFSSVYGLAHANTLILLTCEDESIDGEYLNRRLIFADPL